MSRKLSFLFFAFAFILMLGIHLSFSSIDNVYPITGNKVKTATQYSTEDYSFTVAIKSCQPSLEIRAKENHNVQEETKKEMKVIGLIGGMTWISSAEYYRLINQLIAERLGGFHSARVILYSIDFAEVELAQHQGRWNEAAIMLTEVAKALKRAGADFLVLCTNTMHKLADEIEKGSGLPLIHIADVTGEAIKKRGFSKVGLLGSSFTMEEKFYRRRLKERFGLEVIIPDEKDRKTVSDIIYEELSKDKFTESSRRAYVEVINKLVKRGAEGIILGCTEIPLLIRAGDVDIPLFDTTRLHVEAAVEKALEGIIQP